MSSDIKPCPFCGGNNVRYEATVCNAIVVCPDCHIYGPDGDRGTTMDNGLNEWEIKRKAKAIALWNHRVTE